MCDGSNRYQPWKNKRGELKLVQFELEQAEWVELSFINLTSYCPNVSTTPITAMGCRQCLPLSVVHLKSKHCRKPHGRYVWAVYAYTH